MLTALVNRLKQALDCNERCDPEVYKEGRCVFVLSSLRSKTIEEWVKVLREKSGQRIDWHWIAGRASILVLGDKDLVRKAINETLPALRHYYENIEGPERFKSFKEDGFTLEGCWYSEEFGMIPACTNNQHLTYRLEDIGIKDVSTEVMDSWSSFERGRVSEWACAVSLLKTNEYQKVPSTPDVILPYSQHIDVPKEGCHKVRTFEEEIGKTEYLIEANSNETQYMWQKLSLQAKQWCETIEESKRGHKRYTWEQHGIGMCEQIGTLDDRPVMISIFWNSINGHMIGFWELTSQVCDYKMARDWLNKTFKGVPHTNASNWHLARDVFDPPEPKGSKNG